jgi:polysaccharide biosynthesis/export protein
MLPNRPCCHRSFLLFLATLYTAWTSLPLALVLWLMQGMMFSPALGQTSPSEPPTSRQLLEDARERLLDREGIPVDETDPRASERQSEVEFDRYRLGPGDSVFVNVLRFSDLSFQGTLDSSGNVLVPLVGVMNFQGITVEQAREQIRVALDRYIIDPQVDVVLIAQRPVQVTVLGEVVRPGLYPLPAPQLSTAIISAGGSTGFADLRTVRIRRSLPNGATVEHDFDLFTPLQEADTIPDVQLADGDIIIVPTLTDEDRETYDRTLIARSTLAQPQINVRYLNYAAGKGGVISNLALPNGSSFVDAIAAISPGLDTADIHNIALIRFDVQQGQAVAQELDGKDAFMGDTSQNPMLENNDVIVIGRNLVARITYFLNTFTQPFRDILGFLLFFDSLATTATDLFRPSGGSRDSE